MGEEEGDAGEDGFRRHIDGLFGCTARRGRSGGGGGGGGGGCSRVAWTPHAHNNWNPWTRSGHLPNRRRMCKSEAPPPPAGHAHPLAARRCRPPVGAAGGQPPAGAAVSPASARSAGEAGPTDAATAGDDDSYRRMWAGEDTQPPGAVGRTEMDLAKISPCRGPTYAQREEAERGFGGRRRRAE
eukprot:TRINITY_DN3740_c3_g1_i2.p4 TRINITY_DN3740_c3_g1~~TRINITY_DN3740_c3_g1_i2.p4  ORF type:complete len:197 (+),score=48.98 TRINITY_DN3740_c3_g1_i2:41-592(+)